MTKTKALELMREYSRDLIDPDLARKIAKVFGYTLKDLGIKSQKVKEYSRVNYSDETANLSSVPMYKLSQEIADRECNASIKSMMNGSGSRAEDITGQAINLLAGNAKKTKCSICGNEYYGYGNNAHPINDGMCCDGCNIDKVIPARMIV
mgnify:CR=1 FL=1